MIEILMANYAIETLIIGAIFFVLLIKEIVRTTGWVKEHFINPGVQKAQATLQQEQRLQRDEALIKALMENNIEQNATLVELKDAIFDLRESEKESIKSWITEMHHRLIRQGWVDDYSLSCIEERFTRYKKFDGNSFVLDLMLEIRALPHIPPEQD